MDIYRVIQENMYLDDLRRNHEVYRPPSEPSELACCHFRVDRPVVIRFFLGSTMQRKSNPSNSFYGRTRDNLVI